MLWQKVVGKARLSAFGLSTGNSNVCWGEKREEGEEKVLGSYESGVVVLLALKSQGGVIII